MRASSSRKVDKVEPVAERKVLKPRWLEPFLRKTFFKSCAAHPFYKNELDKYCTTCNRSACQYCMSSGTHRCHKTLKIYRHVYKDVVALSAMEKYIDCSQIQPYKSNKRLVIALNPLPHSGSSSSSNEVLCDICRRRLSDPGSYRYCSISCKVKAVSEKADDSVPPFITIQNPPMGRKPETYELPNPARKRKGTPRRAPFF